MASTAKPGTPRYQRKIRQLQQKRLSERVKSAKKSLLGVALAKEFKAKTKETLEKKYHKQIDELTQRSNYHFVEAGTWRIEAKGLQVANTKLEDKIRFADRRLRSKDETIRKQKAIIDNLIAENDKLKQKGLKRKRCKCF